VVWKISTWTLLRTAIWRGLWTGLIGYLVAMLIVRAAAIAPPLESTICWGAALTIGGLLAIVRGLSLVRSVETTESEPDRLTIRRGFSSESIAFEEIAASIVLLSAQPFSGGVGPSGVLLVTDRRRWRLSSGADTGALFQGLMHRSPYAWGFASGAPIMSPQEVADQTHPNAPERAIGRIRGVLVRVMLGLIASALTAIGLAVAIGIVLAQNPKRVRGLFALILFGYTAYQQLMAALEVGRQIRELGQAEKQLLGF
jgi:hypothetical protein